MPVQTTKRKVLDESIKRCTARIEEIKGIVFGSHYVELLELRKKGQNLLNENKGESRYSKEFIAQISELSKEETRILKNIKIYEKSNIPDLISESVGLEMELADYHHELFYLEQRGKG